MPKITIFPQSLRMIYHSPAPESGHRRSPTEFQTKQSFAPGSLANVTAAGGEVFEKKTPYRRRPSRVLKLDCAKVIVRKETNDIDDDGWIQQASYGLDWSSMTPSRIMNSETGV